LQQDRELTALLGSAIDAASDDNGWAHLGAVGSNLTKQAPDFDSRTWGYSKLSDLLEAMKLFEVERQDKILRVRKSAARR
jgi:hypothetical protein